VADPAVANTPPATPTTSAAAPGAVKDATNNSTNDATPTLSRAPVNAALDGNPGLFTLETGETLPKHGFNLGIGLNKFSNMPGQITSLQLIPAFGYGVTRWFSAFFNIDARDHLHVGAPSQLSLSAANEALNPQFGNTIYPSVIPSTGFRPGYVENVPFASHT